MAKVIQAAWGRLSGGTSEVQTVVVLTGDLISGGETEAVEFKSSSRTNLHTGQQDDKIHVSALKTMAGSLNAKGGGLLIGVRNDGEILGQAAGDFASDDKMSFHLNNLIIDRIGDVFLPYIHAHFEDMEGQRVLIVHFERGPKEKMATCNVSSCAAEVRPRNYRDRLSTTMSKQRFG